MKDGPWGVGKSANLSKGIGYSQLMMKCTGIKWGGTAGITSSPPIYPSNAVAALQSGPLPPSRS
eukprot:13571063-Ditylum_brightwellii.AAC.1